MTVRSTVLLSLVIAACGDATGPAVPLGDLSAAGRYYYFAYDDAERLVLQGTIRIQQHDDTSFAGTWAIAWAPGADTTAVVGPQVGTGDFVGRIWDGELSVDLNPFWVDNNVYLMVERRTPFGFSGRWIYVTIAGPWTEGRFVLDLPSR